MVTATGNAVQSLDLFAGMADRDAGIAQAIEGRNELVNQLRKHLEVLARGRGNRCVTADDCEPFLSAMKLTHKDLGPAAGGLFHTAAWEFTGSWTPSRRKSNRARSIRIWRLK